MSVTHGEAKVDRYVERFGEFLAAEDSRIWRSQLAALADEFTVVAWDEPRTSGGPSPTRS